MTDKNNEYYEFNKKYFNRKSYDNFLKNYLVFPSGDAYKEKSESKPIYSKEYTKLKTDDFVVEIMDIPKELIKSVYFISEHELEITFFETAEFCIEKYFQLNFDVLMDKIFKIRYLDKEGNCVRTDSYTISKIVNITKNTLSNEVSNLTIKIIFECKKHDISTCKE